MEKIIIKYIPNLESAINIFSKDALIYYFNDFLNDEYKSSDLVKDYVDNYLSNQKLELDRKLVLNESVAYKTVNDVNFYKLMYKNSHKVKDDLLNTLFNNPFDFESSSSTPSQIDVEYFNHNLKIYCSVPKELIKDIQYQYKTSINESLYSKLHMIPTTLKNNSELVELNDNTFDYINDIMARYKKDIAQMTDDEYDKIPKYTDKKHKSIEYTTNLSNDIEFWKDDLKSYITNNLEEYTENEIISIMTKLTEKNFNLRVVANMFVNKSELYNNIVNDSIEIEAVYQNANDELKKKEIEQLLNIFGHLKQNKKQVQEINNYIDAKDTVFKNSYKFTKELIEIIDNEDENNLEENYFEYNENILLEDNTITSDNDKYKSEKIFIKELGLSLEKLQPMIDYVNSFSETEKLPAMLFHFYYTIQYDIYTNVTGHDLMLKKECEKLWYENTEPIQFVDNKLILPKTKSVYQYVLCCFKNVIGTITESEFVKKLNTLVKQNQSCQEKLEELNRLWSDIKTNVKELDNNFFKELVSKLKDAGDNVKHINFVKALRYITPKKLKQVNKYISGCCPQLLNQDYKAFGDITNSKDNWFKQINEYLIENIITYDNEWKATSYLPEKIIEYEHFENFSNKMDDIDTIENNNLSNLDNLEGLEGLEGLEDINEYLVNQKSLEAYVKKCTETFMSYVTKTDIFPLNNFILKKCKLIQNVKHLLLAGCLTDSKFYYDFIEHLENICCLNYDLKIKKSKLCIYISARYLSELKSDKNNKIYENLKSLNSKTVLTREEYNKSINNYREELKVKAIDVLESLTPEDKEVAMKLKEFGIIKTYDSYLEGKEDNTTEKKTQTVIYNGSDNNDRDLYDDI